MTCEEKESDVGVMVAAGTVPVPLSGERLRRTQVIGIVAHADRAGGGARVRSA